MNNRTIRFSLRTKLVIGFALLSFFVAIMTALGFYMNLVSQIQNEFSLRALSVVQVAALQQNGDEFAQISSAEDELYEKFRLQNLKVRYSDPDIIYVYTMRKDERGIYFVVDAGEPGEEGIAPYGAIYEEPGPTLVKNFDSMDRAIAEPEIYTDEWGSFLSAYAPIRNSAGQRVGVIAVDILADTILSKQRQILVQSLAIVAIAILLGTFFGYVTGNYLSEPIRNLVAWTQAFSRGDFGTRVDIKTRDEIEELGQSFNDMASQLQELVTNLETRVEERTEALEAQTRQTQQRASQLETISNVASTVSSLQELDQLLPYITQIVSERFDFYHKGIFLLSDDKEYAVLRAANSEGGQKMLARKHQLRVGQEGIVGFAVHQKQARIALDVGSDAVFFDNPDLPATRSEMALPLIVGEEVIGALDVQSEQSNAFSDEDIAVLTILANQVAVAIQNARLFEQSQKAIQELERTFQRYIRGEWQQFAAQSDVMGYRARQTGLEPITALTQGDESTDGIRVPISLRGVTLGNLNIKMDETVIEFSQEELSLVQTIADRLALAMESASLLEDSQRRAAKEQQISEISAKIGGSINLRNVLQTAVEELGRSIPGSEIVIQLREDKGA